RAHLDVQTPRHFLGEGLAVRGYRAIDLAQADVAHAFEGFEEGARHAARAQHADHMRIFARKILHADAGAATDAEMLQHAVIDEGERLAVLGGEQEDHAAIGAGLTAVLLLGPVAVLVLRPGDDVGLHPDCEIAVVRALHRAPAKITVLALA